VIICSAGLSVLAAEDDVSGGGQGEPLRLVSSTPTDGQKDVPINKEIKLIFNKNIVNAVVRDKNTACFVLAASDGNKIPVEVIMADDQVNPEQSDQVTMKPSRELKPGTLYQVKILSQLKAKNGVGLNRDNIISFVTASTISWKAITVILFGIVVIVILDITLAGAEFNVFPS
jgi:hypothetical protein